MDDSDGGLSLVTTSKCLSYIHAMSSDYFPFGRENQSCVIQSYRVGGEAGADPFMSVGLDAGPCLSRSYPSIAGECPGLGMRQRLCSSTVLNRQSGICSVRQAAPYDYAMEK